MGLGQNDSVIVTQDGVQILRPTEELEAIAAIDAAKMGKETRSIPIRLIRTTRWASGRSW